MYNRYRPKHDATILTHSTRLTYRVFRFLQTIDQEIPFSNGWDPDYTTGVICPQIMILYNDYGDVKPHPDSDFYISRYQKS